ncbi:hypothetical protein MRX96_006908 [Rhipicephalus microplus]
MWRWNAVIVAVARLQSRAANMRHSVVTNPRAEAVLWRLMMPADWSSEAIRRPAKRGGFRECLGDAPAQVAVYLFIRARHSLRLA